MGQTIYFLQQKALPDQKWQDLCEDVKALFDISQKLQIGICDGLGEVKFTKPEQLFVYSDHYQSNAIIFNGDAKLGIDYETFELTQNIKESFQFCKTHYHPYGWLVRAILIMAHNKYPGYWQIESFNDKDLWKEVRGDLTIHLGLRFKIPRGCQ